MNTSRVATFSLALTVAVFSLSYVNSSSAAPKNCVENDPRPSCDGGNDPPVPEPEPSATFKVEVFFNEYEPPDYEPPLDRPTADGTEYAAEGKIAGQRRSVSAPLMSLTLDDLESNPPVLPASCDITLGMPSDGQFVLSTYKNKKSGNYTFAEAVYWGFSVGGTNRYGIDFRFEDPDDIQIVGEWLPNSTEVATFAGHQVTLSGQQGGNDDDCEGDIVIDWWIDVTGNPGTGNL